MTSEDKPSWDELKEQASMWLARLDSGNASPEEFEEWRSADPRHGVAFVQVAHVLKQLDRAKPVYKMEGRKVEPTSRRNLLLAVGGLVGVVGVGSGAYLISGQGRAQASTRVGDRQSLGLPGGGHLDLNTDSHVQWKTTNGGTEIWLRRGELAVTSGGVPTKLFAADSIVSLTNGRVNARLRGKVLDLSVLSGACTLEHSGGVAPTAQAVSLTGNQGVLASNAKQVVRSLDQADVTFITGWQQDELSFEGQTLGTAVAEYNRYLLQKIVIADPSLSDIRIGGRFTTHDPKPFLDALRAGFGINAISDEAGTIALGR